MLGHRPAGDPPLVFWADNKAACASRAGRIDVSLATTTAYGADELYILNLIGPCRDGMQSEAKGGAKGAKTGLLVAHLPGFAYSRAWLVVEGQSC